MSGEHDWMIGVIEDLVAYARAHDLPALAEHLDEGRLLALTEIASLPEPATQD
jgi:hypothetical protein